MTSKNKIYILDTNVLILNPHAITEFNEKGNTIIIPFTVLEELDKLKGSKNVGYDAREAVRVLTSLIEKSGAHRDKTIEFQGGGKFILDSGNTLPEHFGLMDSSNMDNRIIATGKKYKNDFPDARIILVSNDANMRLKASAQDIASEEFKAINFGNNGVDDLYQPPQYIENLDESQIQDLFSNPGNSSSCEGEYISYHEPFLFDVGRADDPQAILRSGNDLRFIEKKPYAYLSPRNTEQTLAMYLAGRQDIDVLVLVGKAGTGKTIIALDSALKRRLHQRNEKIIIFRPVDQAGEELGYLPGSLDEKMLPYKKAIGDAYNAIKESKKANLIDFEDACHVGGNICILPINYVRGTTISNSTVIIDEAQNFTDLQMKTLLTRIGDNVNVIITGDPDQIDSKYITKSSCGLTHVIGNFRNKENFAHVTLSHGERSVIARMAADLL